MLYALAVLPAVCLLIFIWKKDKIEKEPPGLLIRLFLFGALTTVSAAVIGTVLGGALSAFLAENSILYRIIENFIIVAMVEEGGKYFVLKRCTWQHPAFNYTFDAVVYAVTASLGFATLENILYLADGSLHLAVMRGLLAVPGHAINAVFMGAYYGLAKRCAAAGDSAGMQKYLRTALIIPTLTHGFYDFVLSMSSNLWFAVFAVYEICITVYAFRTVRRLSSEDQPIGPAIPYLTGTGLPVLPQQGNSSGYGLPPQNDSYDPDRWNRF